VFPLLPKRLPLTGFFAAGAHGGIQFCEQGIDLFLVV